MSHDISSLSSITATDYLSSSLSFPIKSFPTLLYVIHAFMAVNGTHDHQVSVSNVRVPVHANDIEQNQCQETEEDNNIDYYQRAQWLRAAVLGATDGLVSVASLMIGVGAVKKDLKPMLLAGFAGLVAGACSMAIGEFVSVYTQYDIEMSQTKRQKKTRNTTGDGLEKPAEENLPSPVQAAFASALAFSAEGLVPLLGAALIKEDEVRHGMVVAVASIALVVFGVIGAKLGRTPVARSCFRVLVGGWMAMAITFGMIKLIGCSELHCDYIFLTYTCNTISIYTFLIFNLTELIYILHGLARFIE